jgi:cytochrome P450
VAHGTFWPVNAAMFGEATISESRCPGADSWFHAFDEYIPQVTGGMPATMFDEMQEAAAKVVDMFQRSIEAGNHLDAQQCPVLHDRFLPIPHDKLAAYSSKEKAQFMLSLFWAPQANTLPMTWWTLAHILADSRVKSLVEREARGSAFASAPRNGVWPYDEHALPYINACMKEVLRMYIANLTHRSVARDIPVKTGGKWIKIPKKDMLSVASYTRHYDPDVYKEPHVFRPERWLGEEQHSLKDWWPFALGKYSCSGKFLAQGEIPLLVAIFFRDFDANIGDQKMPSADWDKVVASVRPEGWPYNVGLNVTYTKRHANKF